MSDLFKNSDNVPDVVFSGISNNSITIVDNTNLATTLGIAGTATRGPAMVPVSVFNQNDLTNIFSFPSSSDYGLHAIQQWFQNGGDSATFIRTLGAGNCLQRTTSGNNIGKVQNAGFVVGQKIVNTSSCLITSNTYAGSESTNPNALGRTYFLTALMSESAGSTIFSDAGIQKVGQNISQPIIRGVLFAPSGVILSLSSIFETNNEPTQTSAKGVFGSSDDGGSSFGTVNISDASQDFIMLLNGHTGINVITSSFDTHSQIYFSKVFNRDPYKIQELGHYLYVNYDIRDTFAVLTGTGNYDPSYDFAGRETLAFLLTSSLGRNTGSVTDISANVVGIPNYESFEDRFCEAKSPFVVSQKIGNKNLNLFRLHALSDGEISNKDFKVTISWKYPPKDMDSFGAFDVIVRDPNDTDFSKKTLVVFENCDLDQNSPNFIGKKIGDKRIFYDFDGNSVDNRKIVVEGNYPITNKWVRIKFSDDFLQNKVPPYAMPTGFRGISHLVTSGSGFAESSSALTGTYGSDSTNQNLFSNEMFKKVVQPPIPMRENITVLTSIYTNEVDTNLCWGVQFERRNTVQNSNVNSYQDDSVFSFFKYFPNYHQYYQNVLVDDHDVPDVSGSILDVDRFNNNFFSLEKIAVITGSSENGRDPKLPHPDEWASARYCRSGLLPSSLTETATGLATSCIRFLNPLFDSQDTNTKTYFKFNLPIMGGFDGVNIFDPEKSIFSNESVRREFFDSNQSGKTDSSTSAYKTAIDTLLQKHICDVSLVAVPGIRQRQITDHLIDQTQNNFDAFSVIDIEEYDDNNLPLSGTRQENLDVGFTTKNFLSRNIGSSFGAAYFPNVSLNFLSGTINTILNVPPTVSVIGSIAKNDVQLGKFGAPMGARSVNDSLKSTEIKLYQKDVSRLIDISINPITADIKNSGTIQIVSQKTLNDKKNVYDRINMRRLTIEIRRQVRSISRKYLFEDTRYTTINNFKRDIESYLSKLQSQKAITEFKVVLDEKSFFDKNSFGYDNLTDLDKSNILRGRVIFVPISSKDMIELDFDVKT